MRVFFLGILVMCSCFATAQSLVGTSWTLMEVQDESGLNLLKDTLKRASLTFKTDSLYKGEGLCNGHSGSYTASNGNLTMSRPGGTKKYCSGGYGELESKLYNWYKEAQRYSFFGDRLYLYSGTVKLVYRKK